MEDVLGNTTVSKQSAQELYMTDIAAVSCSNRYGSHWASGRKQLAQSCYPG